MRESAGNLRGLRERVARIEGRRGGDAMASFTSGHPALDAFLGGGMARGRLHEVGARAVDDASQATAFAALLAWRAREGGKAMLWLRTEEAERRSGRLYAPGLTELGLDPATLVLGRMPDDVALLRGAADAARCSGVGAIVVECWRNPRALDLTASRRLALAAEQSGATLLLLRIDAAPDATVAHTRWGVRAAPSVALAANAPGHPLFDVELLRSRAGPAGGVWRMEWSRDEQTFREPTFPGPLVQHPAGRPLALPVEPLRRLAR